MATPVDTSRATTDGSTETTSQPLNLPASIASGDLLVAIVRAPLAATFSWPTGWVEVADNNTDASDDQTAIAYKLADGTEGATITVTLSTARRMAGLCYRITPGSSNELVPALSAIATGSASHPNSPSLTLPGVTGTRDTLWLSLWGSEWPKTITTAPTSYTNETAISCTGDIEGAVCTVGGASRAISADITEDPGVWALDSSTVWTAYTFAIYEANPQARLSQLPVEAVISPTDVAMRLSQLAVEAVISIPFPEATPLTAIRYYT